MALFALLLIVQLLAVMPPVQTWVARRVAANLSEQLGAEVTLDRIAIRFFSKLSLQGLSITDQQSDSLLYVDELSFQLVDYSLNSDSAFFHLGVVKLSEGVVNLDFSEEEPNYQFIIDHFRSDQESSSDAAIDLHVRSIQLCKMDVRIKTSDYNDLEPGFDARYIDLNRLDVWIESLDLADNALKGRLRDLSFNERSGLEIEYLRSDFELTSQHLSMDNTWIELAHSEIGINGRLDYHAYSDLSSFIDRVSMDVLLFDTRITGRDFQAFHPSLKKGVLPVYFSGEVSGKVSDLVASNVDVAFGSFTHLSGDMAFRGLPQWDSTFIEFNLENMMTHREDIDFLYAEHAKRNLLDEQLDKMGLIDFKGSLTGYPNQFVSHGDFRSDIGSLRCDIELEIPDGEEPIQYVGELKSAGFNFGELLQTNDLGVIALNVNVDGSGATLDELHADMKGAVSRIDLFGYQYRDIEVNGTFEDQLFEGALTVADSNIQLAFNGLVDLSEEVYKFRFNSQVDKLRPAYLNWGAKDSSAIYKGDLLVNFEGNSIDNVVGRINLSDFNVTTDELNAHLNEAEIVALAVGEGKTIALESDNAKAQVTGIFDAESLGYYIQFIEHQLFPSIDVPLHDIPQNHHIEVTAEINDSSPLVLLYLPSIESFESIRLDAKANYADTSLTVDVRAPNSVVLGRQVEGVSFELDSKGHSSKNKFEIATIAKDDSILITNYQMHFGAQSDSIDVLMTWLGSNRSVEAGKLDFYIVFQDSIIKSSVNEGRFSIAGNEWLIYDQNMVVKDDHGWDFQNVGIYNRDQSIYFNGNITDEADDLLNIEFKQFDLATLTPLLEQIELELGGVLDGQISAEDPDDNFLVKSNLDIDSLMVNDVLLGTGVVKNEWNNASQRLDIEAVLSANDVKTIELLGTYRPFEKEDQLNAQLKLEQVRLEFIQPMVKDFIDPIKGVIRANLNVTGTMSQPELHGVVDLQKCIARVSYLNNTLIVTDQKVMIEPGFIYADALEINDRSGQKLFANFSMFHEHFAKISYDCFLWTDRNTRFMAMNTSSEDNELYYGLLYLEPESKIGLSGSYASNTYIEIDAAVGEGSKLSIPINDDKTYSQEDYIIFIDDDTSTIDIDVKDLASEIIGLDLSMKVRPTPEATVRLVFDEAAGDIITAHGSGNINFSLSPAGDFDITGSYNIEDGDYLFTFQNLLNKRFLLEKDGDITWDGDPYKGMSNIDAVYKVRASLYDLGVVGYSTDTNALKQRVPVELVMHMSGAYTNPTIDFSFRLPDAYDSYQTLLNNLEDGEKNKEAFTLLLLGKFVPIEGMGGAGVANNAFGSNTMEVLSNQLSNWLSKISDDFDVGFSYKPGDDLTSQEVAVALSTQLFNDRVSIQTNFGYHENTNFQNETEFIGDFEVEYSISNDGRVSTKIFHRNNVQDPMYEYSPYTQGVGIAYREDFESFQHLGCRIRKRFLSEEKREELDCDAIERQRQRDKARERNDSL